VVSVCAIGLPMADAAERVQLVDGELQGTGVDVEALAPADSALALILGMVRARPGVCCAWLNRSKRSSTPTR
jgi:siroheme synthase